MAITPELTPRYDLDNEPVSEDVVIALGELYERYAPCLEGTVEPKKLVELFEDIPHVDQFGYLRYDGFFTPQATALLEEADRGEVHYEGITKSIVMFGLLSQIACRNATTRYPSRFVMEGARTFELHDDPGAGHTFLANFSPRRPHSGYMYRLWNLRYEDRPTEGYMLNHYRSRNGGVTKNCPETIGSITLAEDIPIISGQLLVLGGSALDLGTTNSTKQTIPHKVAAEQDVGFPPERFRILEFAPALDLSTVYRSFKDD